MSTYKGIEERSISLQLLDVWRALQAQRMLPHDAPLECPGDVSGFITNIRSEKAPPRLTLSWCQPWEGPSVGDDEG